MYERSDYELTGIRRGGAALALAALLTACEIAPSGLVPSLPTLPPLVPQAHRLVVRAVAPTGFLAGAEICVSSPSGAEERCASSDRTGSATFTLRTGTYLLRGTPPAGARLAPGVATIDLTASGEATVLLEGRAKIAGTIRDAERRLVVGAQVCAHPTDNGATACVRSDATGAYLVQTRTVPQRVEVQGPPDGSRLIGQWAFGRVESFEADVIDVRSADASGIDVTLVHGVVFSGVVRAQRDGVPVEDAQVCTSTLAAPLPWACERTDEDGHYAALREPGRYWVWTIPPGARPDGIGGPSRLVFQRYDRVEVGVDATPFSLFADAPYDVSLSEGALVTGRITLPDGRPVAGAFVCIDTPFPTGRVCRESGTDGVYAVATRPETYTIQVIAAAGTEAVGEWWSGKRDWTDADPVRVGTADVRLDIVLRQGVKVSGVVRTEEGVPVESAPVSFNDARGFLVGTYTDQAGHYEIAVPRGEYLVDVFAPRVSQLMSVVGAPLRVDDEMGFDVVLSFARP